MRLIYRHVFMIAACLAFLALLPPAASASTESAGFDGQVADRSEVPEKDSGAEPQKSAQPAQKRATPPSPSYVAEDWTVAFYPILVWAPVMGANISLPDLPDLPNLPPGSSGGIRNGNVSGGLNGVALFGVSVQKKRFVGDLSVLWGSVGASSTSPRLSIDTGVVFADATAGVKIFNDLALVGGVRRMALKIDATLGDRPQVTWKPGIWDPLIGLQLRKSLGKKWGVDLRVDGGGFGVGSDVDISATGRLDWRFSRHFGMTMGYGGLHFKFKNDVTVLNQTFTREVGQTLHGPIFGFGIYF
jgi:hypothetical protein